MRRPIAVLRPEPGNRLTAAAIEAAGGAAIRLPLFAAAPMAWQAPDPADFDALVLTSANALRHGGAQLAALTALPVYAVGAVTAEAARRHGFDVVATGDAGAAALLAQAEAQGVRRALHLSGRERSVAPGGIVARIVAVYASDALPVDGAARLIGSIALVQSARAGARLAEIIAPRERRRIALVAISAAAATAAGSGWEAIHVAAAPSTQTLIDTALALAD